MQLLSQILEWLDHHAGLTALVIVAWIVVLVFSLWAVRHFLISIPDNYFAREHKPLERWRKLHPVLRWVLLIGKNLLGAMLVAAGIVMLFTPGQGVLALLLGVALVDVPGKRALERRIVQQPAVTRIVNLMRAKADRPPLVFDSPFESRD